jgi:hypothetical protein
MRTWSRSRILGCCILAHQRYTQSHRYMGRTRKSSRGRDKDVQLLERDDAPWLGGPGQKFILPRTLNLLYKLGEVHVGCEYRGFIRVIFLQIEEKR